jgi:Flp pilus assembly protein TadG
MILRSTQSGNRRLAKSLVEFAIVAPVFLLIIMGILEYARLLFFMQLMNNAAREGARYTVANNTTVTTAQIQTYVDQYLAGQASTQLTNYNLNTSITVYKADPNTGQNTGMTWQSAGWGDMIGVSITGNYQPITPGMLSLTGNLAITSTCVMTNEAN